MDCANLGKRPGPTTNPQPMATYPGRQFLAPDIKPSTQWLLSFWDYSSLGKSDYRQKYSTSKMDLKLCILLLGGCICSISGTPSSDPLAWVLFSNTWYSWFHLNLTTPWNSSERLVDIPSMWQRNDSNPCLLNSNTGAYTIKLYCSILLHSLY